MNNYDDYAADMTRLLEEQEDGSFEPDLVQLDGLIQSLLVLAGGVSGNRANEYDYSGWHNYENPAYAYMGS